MILRILRLADVIHVVLDVIAVIFHGSVCAIGIIIAHIGRVGNLHFTLFGVIEERLRLLLAEKDLIGIKHILGNVVVRLNERFQRLRDDGSEIIFFESADDNLRMVFCR